MKIATQKIIERLPMLKDKIPNYDSVLLEERTLAELDKTKQTFLKMIWFFEEPRKNDFNIGDIQADVDPSWVSFALECIMTYFQKDTYLTEEPDFSLITDETEYLSPSECAQYFTRNGLDFSRQKFNVYVQRGNIPEPDLTIGDRKFWLKETCDTYLERNMTKQESNNKTPSSEPFFDDVSTNLLNAVLDKYGAEYLEQEMNMSGNLKGTVLADAKRKVKLNKESK